MRRAVPALVAALLSAMLLPASTARAADCSSRIEPATFMKIEDCDTPDRIIEKAANVVPSKGQLGWQQREITAFTHFGVNTFTNREWGSGAEDPKTFAPEKVDVAQWMDTYKSMGAELAMLTAKHHDGFNLYPTRYSPHSIKNSAYDGDLLRTYATEARKRDMKVGVYLSPADGSEVPHAWHADWLEKLKAKQDAGEQLTSVEKTALEDGGPPSGLGRYGNGSAETVRTIPTLVEGDDRREKVASGELPTFKVKVNDYDAYYLNQVYEILTEYGPIDEFWLDGANPWRDAGVEQKYNFRAYFDLIHALSPNTVIFQGFKGIRWVGNEKGIARETEWSVTPHSVDPRSNLAPLPNDSTDPDIGSRSKLLADGVKYLQWYPAEADVSNRPGWFHHPDQQPKTAAQLTDLYEKSVGRNAPLLLNVPPGKDGRISDADVRELKAFGDKVRSVYGENVLSRGGPGSPRTPATFDRVRLAEDISRGQRVEAFTVQARDPASGAWRDIASGTTIGAYRILPLAEPVTADALRVRVTESRATPHLKRPTAHLSTAGQGG